MKRLLLTALTILIVCGVWAQDKIVLKVTGDNVKLELGGNGRKVDWGDGSVSTENDGKLESMGRSFSHQYSKNKTYTIVVTGNITRFTCERVTREQAHVTSIDLSKCPELNYLHCGSNKLTSLDVSKCPKLTELSCRYNEITSLDISKCPDLTTLYCNDNQLTRLDVSQCPKLEYIECYSNKLTNLDMSKSPSLKGLSCSRNQLTNLNLSACPDLRRLICKDNQLTSIDVSAASGLKALSFSRNRVANLKMNNRLSLEEFECDQNQLTNLDLRDYKKLKMLDCSANRLTTLIVSGCSALVRLQCSSNQLSTLDLYGCTALEELQCHTNQLQTLYLSNNIEKVFCSQNKLDYLDVSGCANLSYLDVGNNPYLKNISYGSRQPEWLRTAGCPALSVSDPSGAISVNMRNTANGRVTVNPCNCNSEFYIDGDNFRGTGYQFIRIGKVNDLGNVSKVHRNDSRWSNVVAVTPGYGYVGRCGDQYFRIYVVREMLSAINNGVIGAEIKYAPL